jgi:cytochrome c oxidase assembly protein subunit 15
MAGPRKLFEEVGEAAPPRRIAPAGGLIDREGARGRLALRNLLGALFLLVVLMVAVGGATRLTDSGLSITEWRPVTGALPPISAEHWQAEFDRYRASPQYRLMNRGMSLAEFKVIYWWEWGHRQLGRVIGLVWAIGFLALWLGKRLPPGWAGRMWLLGALGAAQGAIGWWMVRSGLAEGMTSVASTRLAVHLGLAFAILGLLAWYLFLLGRPAAEFLRARRQREPGLALRGGVAVALCFGQILLGALVAGIDAGRTFTDWPLMAGGFLPPDPFALTPLWRNVVEDPGLVQFLHRMGGYLLLLWGLWLWAGARGSVHPRTRAAGSVMLALLALQLALGIATVLHAAPLWLALPHQIVAVALWVAILRLRFLALYPIAVSLRERRA